MTAAIATEENRRVGLAIVALALGAVAMGASVLFVRWADVGPYASAFWRVFLALPILFAWMRLAQGDTRLAPLFSDRTVLLAGLFFTGDLFFWHLEAVAAASFGWLLLNEPPGLVQTLGGVLILIGIWIARPRTGQQVEVGL